MSLFVLDEFEMTLSQLGKLTRKKKVEAKRYKHIKDDAELHDALNEKCWKQYAVV